MTADRDDTASETAEGTSDVRTVPAEDDEGKTVVDRQGQDIGIVTKVEGDTMYVDPDPSITERIASALNWNMDSEDELPVSPEFVEQIEDQVVLQVKRDEDFQER